MFKFDIIVHPSCSEPELPPAEPHQKLNAKWRASWRTKMLAKPKPPAAHKYKPPPPRIFKRYFDNLDPETEFRSEQIARPHLRTLVDNKRIFKNKGPKFINYITKLIDKSWNSIYNYYRKRLRERRLKRLQKKIQRLQAKKPTGKELQKLEALRQEHLQLLATPKKLFLPEKIERKRKALEELEAAINALAMPKQRDIQPPRPLPTPVSPDALTYEITEAILKLSEVPEKRKKHASDDINPFAVKRAALKAICTPQIEKLAQPSFSAREARKQDEDKYDPWAIPPNALKYRPTARILELAKPLERK